MLDRIISQNLYLKKRLSQEMAIVKQTLFLREALQKIASLPKTENVETAIKMAYTTLDKSKNLDR